MSCGPLACERFLQWRVIGRPPKTQSSRGAGGSGLQGIGAASGPAPGLPRAVEYRKPSSERKHDNDDDVSALPEAKRRIWRSLAKPKQARNFKDLKGLKCRYTFGIRALLSQCLPAACGGPSCEIPPMTRRSGQTRRRDRTAQGVARSSGFVCVPGLRERSRAERHVNQRQQIFRLGVPR